MAEFTVLAINPGSTSTKIGLFKNDQEVFKTNIMHAKEELSQFKNVADQRPYRAKLVKDALVEAGINVKDINAFAARGGSFASLQGGVYAINDTMIKDAVEMKRGAHPANLAVLIADEMSKEHGQPCYVVNGPSVDEFMDLARLTGLKGIYRRAHAHALNHKEIAHRYAAKIGKKYDELNLVIAHIGGGISIAAHAQGRMVDASDAIYGEGPMAPTRTGTVHVMEAMDLVKQGVSPDELKSKSTLTGGWVDHVGIDDGRELAKRIEAGDLYAKLLFETTVYQISKWIGMMAVPLKGKVDAVILTGGLSNDKKLVEMVSDYVGYLGTIEVMPGEFELEGLAAGVVRALTGEETPQEYTGKDSVEEFVQKYGI